MAADFDLLIDLHFLLSLQDTIAPSDMPDRALHQRTTLCNMQDLPILTRSGSLNF